MPTPSNITKIEFDDERFYVHTKGNGIVSQPLKNYPCLQKATDEQRSQWETSYGGIHWRCIDADISFESFFYDDADPNIVRAKF